MIFIQVVRTLNFNVSCLNKSYLDHDFKMSCCLHWITLESQSINSFACEIFPYPNHIKIVIWIRVIDMSCLPLFSVWVVIYILGSYFIKLPGARPFGSDWDSDTVIEYSNYTNINPNNN